MVSKSLKTKMGVTVVSIIILSMLLIDFAVIIIAQRDMIQSEVEKNHMLISSIESYSGLGKNPPENLQSDSMLKLLDPIVQKTDASCVLYFSGKSQSWIIPCDNQNLGSILKQQAVSSAKSGEKKEAYWGSTWGILWKQKEHLIISRPVNTDLGKNAAIAVAVDLKGIYETLRNRHNLFLLYIFANTMILSFIVLNRLSLLVIKPIQNLLKRAENYREDSEVFILLGKENDEFRKLSRSLNLMLRRISDDRKKLRETINSLEMANSELRLAQKEIIRAEKLASVGRLSSGIAHEIGNPLSIILGYLDLIRERGFSDEEKMDFIDRAEKEISRIKKIIKQLLDFSMPSEEGKKIVSVHEVLKEIISILKYQPIMANIRITLDLNAQHDRVLADHSQLSQVFLNLMINAADAVYANEKQEYGNLVIKTKTALNKDENQTSQYKIIKIIFRDDGPGIPSEALENIYDPFYTTKEPGKGTGLGLSVCFMIVEGMGGKIGAKSEEDKGTEISLHLPVVEE